MSAVVVAVETTATKGRALVTTRDVAAGEAVVDELPILLSLYDDAKDLACARCLRAFDSGGGANGGGGGGTAPSSAVLVPCPACRQVAFCSPACAEAAANEPWVHAPATCRAYAAGLAALPEPAVAGRGGNDSAAAAAAAAAEAAATEARSALRFLIQALALRALALQQQSAAAAAGQAASPPLVAEGAAKYAQLLSLCGAGGEAAAAAAEAARALLPALAAAVGGAAALPAEEELAALLSREQANSFAVEAPPPPAPPCSQKMGRRASAKAAAAATAAGAAAPAPAPARRRRLLGGALYARAALVNHECLPNVARFDDFADPSPAPPQGRLRLVAMHALPKGTELALSYVPLRWPAARRRAHCRAVYGFDCACARCALEARADVFSGARDAGGGGGGGGADGPEESEWETDEEEEEDDGEWETDEEGEGMEEEEEEGQEEEEEAGGGGGGGRGATAMEAEAAADAGAPEPAPANESEAMDPTYLHLFLLKYVCARKGCTGGTLAPSAPGRADVLRCNACGGERTEAEFLAELNGGRG